MVLAVAVASFGAVADAAPPPVHMAAPAVAPELACDASVPANLYWLLNALAGDPLLDSSGWRAWWQAEGLAGPDDAVLLAEFARLRGRWRGRLADPQPRDNPWVPPAPPAAGRLDLRWSALFLGAADTADLVARADVLLDGADEAAFAAIVASFAPRLARWQQRSPWLAAFPPAFDRFAAESQLPAFLAESARWLGAPAGGRVRVHFVLSAGAPVRHARRLGEDLLVEVAATDTPLRRGDTVAHEVVHWLQERAGLDDDPLLIDALFAADDAAAAPCWELLSEGLATALGQGIWQRRSDPQGWQATVSTGGSWYADPRIDAIAKAWQPLIEPRLGEPAGLRALMPTLRAAAAALPPPPRLSALLGRYVLLSDSRDDPWMQHAWWRVVPPRAVWRAGFDEAPAWAQRYRGVTLVVVATWAQWQAADAAARQALGVALPPPARRKQAQRFAARRAGGAFVLAVAAADEAGLARAMAALAASAWPWQGWVAVP